MQFNNPIVGEEELIRSAIKSQNYTAGSSGWRIAADGSAEFTGLVVNSAGVQGTITLENGEIVVRRNSDNEIIARMYSSGEGGFRTRDPDWPDISWAELSSHYLQFNKETDPAEHPGTVGWDGNSLLNSIYMQSGAPTNAEAIGIITVRSSTGAGIDSTPEVQVYGSNGTACELTVNGDIEVNKSGPFSTVDHGIYINGIDQGRGLRDWVAINASTATVTTTETAGYNSNLTTFKAGRAYKLHVKLLLSSDTVNDIVRTRTRRTNTAGAILMDSQSLCQIPGVNFSVPVDYTQVVVNNTGADISDVLVVTYHRLSGAGNVRIVANATNVAFIEVTDVGEADMYPNAIAL